MLRADEMIDDAICRGTGVRYWHFSDMLRQSSDVRCWGLNRPKSAASEGRLLTIADFPGRKLMYCERVSGLAAG